MVQTDSFRNSIIRAKLFKGSLATCFIFYIAFSRRALDVSPLVEIEVLCHIARAVSPWVGQQRLFLEIFSEHVVPIGSIQSHRLYLLCFVAWLPLMSLHINKVIMSMSQLLQAIKLKPEPIQRKEIAELLMSHLKGVEEEELQAIIEGYLAQKETLSLSEGLEVAETISQQIEKINPKQKQLSKFYFNSWLRVEGNQVGIQSLGLPTNINVNTEFIDTIGEDFYKKLINYASQGLLYQKVEEKHVRRYTFFQWVENDIDLNIHEEQDLRLILLKQVWAFRFLEVDDTIRAIKEAYPEDEQIDSVETGLRIFTDIYNIFAGNEELKEKFVDRKEFPIKMEEGHSNKREEKDFNNKISEVKQQLYFASSYFQITHPNFSNRTYASIAAFLKNREDNFVKEEDDPTIKERQLSIVDRFLFAKRFYRHEDFEHLRKRLIQNPIQDGINLQKVVLYGTRRESEQIIQGYVDQTNEIQKAATISVLLRILLQQGKVGGNRESKGIFYNRLIKQFEFLLVSMDSGISKHKFNKKCITMEVERKKKTMNKTFKFNCSHCKYSQCLLSISKRIAADTRQTQPRMKGNNLFAKDNRNQVRHCLDCMQLLPKCCVCLFPVTVYNGYAEEMKRSNSNTRLKNKGESLQNALVWCPKCLHGGHFSHIMQWMDQYEKRCPVANCKCKCER